MRLYRVGKQKFSGGSSQWTFKRIGKNMYYCIDNKDTLKRIISQYEAVSFDVWDTLITRTVLQPEDVFSIIGMRAEERGIHIPDFCRQRQKAVLHVAQANPNISEIYNELQDATNISDIEKEALIEIEIQIESKVIMPRREMIEILDYAVSLGKQVSLITDMYLPKSIMEIFLKQVGIQNYGKIFVSCDYRQLKIESLYKHYKDEVLAESYIHIGDNTDSDVVAAQRWGIDSVLIKKGYDILKESPFASLLLRARSHNEKCLVGLFCACLFNSPFCKCDRVYINDSRDLGWLFIAPMISEFMHWLGNEVKKEDYDGVLFASRDGYLPHKLYSQMRILLNYRELPEGIYFLTSRALCTQAGIKEDKDILWLASVKFSGSERELLHYRFGLKEEEIFSLNKKETSDIKEYVMLHRDKIYEKAAENRQNYLTYIRQKGIESGKKYAFFDFVSSGTCQYYLKRFLPFELKGKYFCRSLTDDEKTELAIDSLYINNGVLEADSLLYEIYQCLETIMTSPTPSLLYIDRKLNAVYDEEVRSKEELSYISDIQDAIEKYFEYFKYMCDWNEDVCMDMAENLYQNMSNDSLEITCKALEGMQLRDDWVREMVKK